MENPKIKIERKSKLDPFYEEIKELFEKGVSLSSIQKIINPKLTTGLSFSAYRSFCKTRLGRKTSFSRKNHAALRVLQ